MANITVKNAANADVIYVAATPSAGDKSPARWTQNALTPIIGFRPVFEVKTRDSGGKPGRILDGSLRYPVTQVVSGITTQAAVVPISFSATLPTNVDSTVVSDAFVQLGNLLASTLIRAVAADGYAPT
jgi:hypothetical protein